MQSTIETVINKIDNELSSLEDIKNYFETNQLIDKKNIGEIIESFILRYNHDILETILSSNKFKQNNDCLNQYGEPIVQSMLYAIKTVYENNEISYEYKDYFKRSVLNVLTSQNCHLNWRLKDFYNLNTPLHILIDIIDYMSNKELKTLFNFAMEHGINPLDKNENDLSPIDMIINKNMDESFKQYFLHIMLFHTQQNIITIKSEVYE